MGSAAKVSDVALEMACGPVSDSISTELMKSTLQAGRNGAERVTGARVGGDNPSEPPCRGRCRQKWNPTENSSLHLREGTGQGVGQTGQGISPISGATYLLLASAGQWLSWQGLSYLLIHLWGLKQKFN